MSLAALIGARAPPKQSAPATAPAAAVGAGAQVRLCSRYRLLHRLPEGKSCGQGMARADWHGLIGTGDHELQESLVEQTLKEPTRSSCDASWRQWAMARIVSSSGRLRSCFWRSQSGSLPPRLEF